MSLAARIDPQILPKRPMFKSIWIRTVWAALVAALGLAAQKALGRQGSPLPDTGIVEREAIHASAVDAHARPLTINNARVCVTGADQNRPDPFPGLGNFIGWPGGIDRMPDGDLLLGHSAGYWHSSFAQPRQIEPKLRERWTREGWPLDFPAPTGGRVMACRSSDNGRTWSRPVTIVDHRLDDGAHAVFACRDGTVLCFVGVQASWYGYAQAPEGFQDDIDGLNTKQLVLRSTDSGKSERECWSATTGRRFEPQIAGPSSLGLCRHACGLARTWGKRRGTRSAG